MHSAHILILVHIFCLFSDITGYKHNVSHQTKLLCLCWGRTVFFWSKIPLIFLSPERAITPHTFGKHSGLGQLCRVPSAFPTPPFRKELPKPVPSFSSKINSLCQISLGCSQHLAPHTTSTEAGARHIPAMLPSPNSPPFPESSPML